MSFKSKQRAKHGHLFGDDPLNAALVSASDDPLFSPTTSNRAPAVSSNAQSQSSRTNSPLIPNDPLSRPADTSSSTPLSPRRTGALAATTTTSPNGSIFGDIDVSKLSKKHTVRSPAPRNRQYDLEDEDDLFGGGYRTRKTSKAIPPSSSSSSSSSHVKSPTMIQHDIPTPKKVNVSPPPMAVSASPMMQQKPIGVQEEPTTASKPAMRQPIEQQQKEPVKNETLVAKPTVSSSSSSIFRFFKSSNNKSSSKNSSSASSIASVNAPSSIVKTNDAVNSLPPAALPPTPPQQQQQQSVQSYHIKPNKFQQQKDNEEQEQEQEEEEEPQEQLSIIEDEATRAFAEDNVMSFKPAVLNYRSFSPELTMDALKIDTHATTTTTTTAVHKKLVPSMSTPTNNVEDPWSNLLIQPSVEPSISSPLIVKVQDIEPQKRTAFADLITSWNTGKSNHEEYRTPSQDPTEFFNHVAAERRDIGFAGIREQDDQDAQDAQDAHYHHGQPLDYQEDMNPWH